MLTGVSRQIIEVIHRERKRRGISLSRVSQRTGISVSTLSRLERGKRKLTIDTLYIIAGAIGISVKEVLP